MGSSPPPPMQPPAPPSNRRRSSFFDRRMSLPLQEVPAPDVQSSQKNIQRYVDDLESEISQWKNLFYERRNKYRELKKKCAEHERPPHRDEEHVTSLISEDVSRLLGQRPDLDEIQRESLELCGQFNSTLSAYSEYVETVERIRDYLKDRVREITIAILDHSDIENDQ